MVESLRQNKQKLIFSLPSWDPFEIAACKIDVTKSLLLDISDIMKSLFLMLYLQVFRDINGN